MIKQTKYISAAILSAGILSLNAFAVPSDTATQTVAYEVTPINLITVSGDPGALTVSTATPGSAPSVATDATTTYAVTTNESNRTITGQLNTVMPSGVTLSVTLASSASSSGKVPLIAASASELVTGISNLNESGKTISYELAATSAAGVVSGSRTVTLTIQAGS